jgi:hypothetical protein
VGRTVRGVNGVVHLGLLAPLAPRVGARLPPICFRVVSWVPQNGFVGRADDGLPIVASPLWRFTGFRRLSFNPGQVKFSVAKVLGRLGSVVAHPCSSRGFPPQVGSTGNVKIACLAPFVALR